jgi:hypothetical protein
MIDRFGIGHASNPWREIREVLGMLPDEINRHNDRHSRSSFVRGERLLCPRLFGVIRASDHHQNGKRATGRESACTARKLFGANWGALRNTPAAVTASGVWVIDRNFGFQFRVEMLNARPRIDEQWTLAGRNADGLTLLELMDKVEHVADEYAQAREKGNYEVAAVIDGQACGLIHDVPPAVDIVKRICAEAEPVIANGCASSSL